MIRDPNHTEFWSAIPSTVDSFGGVSVTSGELSNSSIYSMCSVNSLAHDTLSQGAIVLAEPMDPTPLRGLLAVKDKRDTDPTDLFPTCLPSSPKGRLPYGCSPHKNVTHILHQWFPPKGGATFLHILEYEAIDDTPFTTPPVVFGFEDSLPRRHDLLPRTRGNLHYQGPLGVAFRIRDLHFIPLIQVRDPTDSNIILTKGSYPPYFGLLLPFIFLGSLLILLGPTHPTGSLLHIFGGLRAYPLHSPKFSFLYQLLSLVGKNSPSVWGANYRQAETSLGSTAKALSAAQSPIFLNMATKQDSLESRHVGSDGRLYATGLSASHANTILSQRSPICARLHRVE